MSYRTYVNDFQIFGNDECYGKWMKFIKSQGIEVDAEDNYDGYITDVMGALKVIEEIVMDEEERRKILIAKCKDPENDYCPKSLFDFSSMYDRIKERPTDFFLLDEVKQIVDNGYIFMPLAFIKACGNDIEKAHHEKGSYRFYNYKIKEGCKIHIEAH